MDLKERIKQAKEKECMISRSKRSSKKNDGFPEPPNKILDYPKGRIKKGSERER